MANIKKTLCPNCENSFNGQFDFCPHCSQRNKEMRLVFRYLIGDLLAGSLNIDSKFFITFRTLISKPAILTKEFFKGKRTKYLTPIRIYLLVSFVYFAMLSFTNNSALIFDDNEDTSETPVVFNNSDTDTLANIYNSTSVDTNTSKAIELNVESDSTVFGIEMDKLKSLNKKEGRNNFRNKFNEYTSVSMFFIIPIAAILLFWFFGKDTYYIEHLVFLIHLQSLVFLIMIIFGLLYLLIPFAIIDAIRNILILVSVILWIKSYYKFKWIKSIFASLLFLISYLLVLGVSFIFLAWVSLIIL